MNTGDIQSRRPGPTRRLAGLLLFLLLCGGIRPVTAANFSWVASSEALERSIMEADLSLAAEAEEIEAQVYLNPQKRFIAGTARLRFGTAGPMKMFGLCPGLTILDIVSPNSALRLFRRDSRIFVSGENIRELAVYFSGTLPAERNELQDTLVEPSRLPGGTVDSFFTLPRCLYWVPSTTRHFVRSRVTVNVPANFTCLASGSLSESSRDGEMNRFTFCSAGTKGLSLTCGEFRRAGRVDALVPLNLFSSPGLSLDPYKAERLRGIVDFFSARFGRLDVPELNLVFRRDLFFGGYSHSGFLVGYVDNGYSAPDQPMLEQLRLQSPLAMNDARWDSLVHEISHQWWGGLVSWQLFADVWIIEGLAQYSTLLYLGEQLPAGDFDRLLQRMGDWVRRKAGAGKVTDGQLIAFGKKDPLAYQAIVYNKSAFIFRMLGDLLGETEMAARLRGLLAERRYSCWRTAEFLEYMGGGDPLLRQFFDCWTNRSDLPDVVCRVSSEGQTARITVTQTGAPFVFPLRVTLRSAGEDVQRVLTVSRGSETFTLESAAPLRGVDVGSRSVPGRIAVRKG